jgi:uncharacterized repeat protein (TIGR01451 family)
LILGVVAVVSAQAENVSGNLGFEESNLASRVSENEGPLRWSYSWFTSPVHSSGHSVGIDIDASWYEGWQQSKPPVPITATEPHTFSSWIRTDRAANHAFLRLVLDAAGRGILTRDSNAMCDTTDWVQVYAPEPVVAPADALFARIQCRSWDRGEAWYDDILLRHRLRPVADLEIGKSAQPSVTVRAGELLTYTLRYSNIGNTTAEGVVITDTLPLSVAVASSNPLADGQPEPHILTWNFDTLAEGGTPHTITIVVTVSKTIADGEWLTNVATIAAENAMSATAWITTEVTSPVLEVEKGSSAESVSVYDTLLYTVTYKNVGGADAASVWLTDTLPISVTLVSLSRKEDARPDSHTLVWDIGDLKATDKEETIVITVIVNLSASGQELTNCVELRNDETGDSECKPVGVNPVNKIYLPVLMKNYPPPITIGDFEQGWNGWTHGGELNQYITSTNAYSGTFSALLGDPEYKCKNGVPKGSAWMERTVFVPPAYSELSFRYNIFTHDKNSSLGDEYDSFDVTINGSRFFRDANTTEPYKCKNLRDLGWRSGTIDLNGYRGTYITIRFENWNRFDKWYNTWTYVDAVQITP